jgi:hypothetical protein
MYVVRCADQGFAVSSIRVHLAAIRTAHLLAGLSLDLRHPRLAMVVEGVTRAKGVRPRRQAAADAGLDPERHSGHSLHAGLAELMRHRGRTGRRLTCNHRGRRPPATGGGVSGRRDWRFVRRQESSISIVHVQRPDPVREAIHRQIAAGRGQRSGCHRRSGARAAQHHSITRSALSAFELRQRPSQPVQARGSSPSAKGYQRPPGRRHAADVGPGLARHELVRLLAKLDSGFAHALECTWSVRR